MRQSTETQKHKLQRILDQHTGRLSNELRDLKTKWSDAQRWFGEAQKVVDNKEQLCFDKEKKVEALEQKFVEYQKNIYSYGYGNTMAVEYRK